MMRTVTVVRPDLTGDDLKILFLFEDSLAQRRWNDTAVEAMAVERIARYTVTVPVIDTYPTYRMARLLSDESLAALARVTSGKRARSRTRTRT